MTAAAELKPRILFLTRSLNIGGAERQMVELAVGLHHCGWRVRVATFYGGGVFEQRLRDAGLETVCLRKSGRWDVLRFGWRLVSLLRSERADIVHGYLHVANILLALLRASARGSRVVWGVRDSDLDVRHCDALFRLEYRLGMMLSPRADLIICNSHAGLAFHAQRGYSAERMIVIPNGIDIGRFAPDMAARAAVRAEWGLSGTERLVGIVARLDPMKDHPSFLRAAARVAASRPDVRFVCVGEGPPAYRDELIAMAGALGLAERVIWSAGRMDVQRVYNALDLAVSASAFGEGFSNTIAEAMATGTPCVVTDVGDSAAIVGDLGWVCIPRDSDALAFAISSALDALPADSARIRQQIAANYSTAELVRRTAEELSQLLRGEPTRHPRSIDK